jgi:hypothetical protein
LDCRPVTVAARSKAWTVFARSDAGFVVSNPTQGMDVWCVYAFILCLCCPVFRQRPCDGLITRPRNVTFCEKWLRNWIRDQGPEWAGRAIEKKKSDCRVLTQVWRTNCTGDNTLEITLLLSEFIKIVRNLILRVQCTTHNAVISFYKLTDKFTSEDSC